MIGELKQKIAKGEDLYNAYCILGDPKELGALLDDFFQPVLGVRVAVHPDCLSLSCEVLTVDDARFIKEFQNKRPVAGERKIIVAAFDSATREAQNSLLKVLEEPTAGTHFFILTRSADRLLPTLRSRLFIYRSEEETMELKEGKTFLSETPLLRLKFLEEIIREKDKQAASGLVRQVTRLLYDLWKKKREVSLAIPLSEAMRAEQSLQEQGVSVKLVMEHLSLTLPVIRL